MSRLNELENRTFDVLVVGAGIHGATAAWALSQQGVSVALIDKDDFGAAASANSEKIIHGGLRYLQQLDFVRMRESIVSRRKSLRLLPHLTHPASFMVPTSGFTLRSKAALLAAMIMNDVVSFDRNKGLDATRSIPGGRLYPRSFLRGVAEGLADAGSGAAVWHDGFAENTERFTLSFALTAEKNGAVIRNYMRAEKLLLDGSRVIGACVTDVLSGDSCDVRAKVVVNAAGGWLENLLPESERSYVWTRAYNVVLNKKLFGPYGVGLEAVTDYVDEDALVKRGKRNYFCVPWRDGTILGTMYKTYDKPPDECSIAPHEIEDWLAEINTMYPAAALSLDDVTFGHTGILPARTGRTGKPSADPAKDTEVLDYDKLAGVQGLLVIKGVKYTTAIEVAGKVVRKVIPRLNRAKTTGVVDSVVGGEQLITVAVLKKEFDFPDDVLAYHAIQYGTVAHDVLALCKNTEENSWRIIEDQPVLVADIIYAITHERALRLSDMIFRRTALGSFRYPGRKAVKRVADIMAGKLGWTQENIKTEIECVEDHYRRMGVGHTLER